MFINKSMNLYMENKQPLYSLSGIVIYGKGIGKLVGMPTANLQMQYIEKPPPIGVYTTVIIWNSTKYYGATNVGNRPTLENNDKICIETNIFDFNIDIYGQEIEILLYKFLRLPLKFDSLSLLREQIFIDCKITRKYFNARENY